MSLRCQGAVSGCWLKTEWPTKHTNDAKARALFGAGSSHATRHTSRARDQCAFTLIELLTVVAIIAVLAGIVIGVGRRASETGKIARAKAELAAISAGLEGYRLQYGDYPRTNDEAQLLQSLIGRLGPTQAAISARARIDLASFKTQDGLDPTSNTRALLIDPWDQPYVYVYKVPASGWTNPSFVLYSIGPDGQDTSTLLAGGSPDAAAAGNADNIYANQ
ncbi:MAG TPA: type II secretion system protein GspG [Opitutus sp.]|nr:type II secretion system protein GspG [Opitutus sp.]